MKNKINGWLNRFMLGVLVLAGILMTSLPARADTDVTAIVSGASAVFTAVATLCVAIGIFFVGYRLAKRVR